MVCIDRPFAEGLPPVSALIHAKTRKEHRKLSDKYSHSDCEKTGNEDDTKPEEQIWFLDPISPAYLILLQVLISLLEAFGDKGRDGLRAAISAKATNRTFASVLAFDWGVGAQAWCLINIFNGVVFLLHAPDELQPYNPKDVRKEPDSTEEPQLRIGEVAGAFDGNAHCSRVFILVSIFPEFVPQAPAIILENLVKHDCAEVEEVSQGRDEN